MTTSPYIGIPQLAQSQANPDITFNEAFVLVQALLNGVKDKDLTSPPGSPAEGDAYIVGALSTGAWSGRDNSIAIYWGGSWRFIPGNDSSGTPIAMGANNEGVTVFVRDEDRPYLWTGSAWIALLGTSGGALPLFEQGTWTPSITFATPGDLAITYGGGGGRAGHYTRIGNLVMLNYNVNTTAFTWTTASGAMSITGIPFTSISTNLEANTIRWTGINKATFTSVQGIINASATSIGVSASGMGVTTSNVTAADTTSGTNLSLRGQISYLRA